MYASLGQLVRGWSRILYDALDRERGGSGSELLDALVFSQSGHVALAAAWSCWRMGRDRTFRRLRCWG